MQRFQGVRVGIPTLHGKEQIIRRQFASWQWEVVVLPFDTNSLGTFSGEVERPADPLATAWMKAEAGLPFAHGLDLLLASEGSFYPHPEVPLITLNTEQLVLLDLRTQHRYHVSHTDYFPPAARVQTGSWPELADLARQLNFPGQGLILTGTIAAGQQRIYRKDFTSLEDLQQAYAELSACCDAVWAETDFRAHRSPLRQDHIATAASLLLEKLACCCPVCSEPGFGKSVPMGGLPCSWCGTPTRHTRSWIYRCGVCSHEAEIPVSAAAAEPGHCDRCNP